MNKSLSIQSERNIYQVSFANTLDELIQALSSIKNSFTIIDQEIKKAYPALVQALKAFSKVLVIEATEETKTLAGSELVLQFLQKNNATKSSTVIAVGGGITQDIASFAAHIYYRGLPFVFVPTTLLAMSDSCIGGKCGLNYKGYKNQIGAFHSPEQVWIWTGFTETLSDDAIYSGYGEIFKLMLIGDQTLYLSLCLMLEQEGFRNSAIADHIFKALEIKKIFIEQDEFDTGIRRILNYGHTFGHAIELATEYAIPHGIAVIYGLDIANYIACQKGFLNENLYLDIHRFIKKYFPIRHDARIQADTLLTNVLRDKKIANGKLNMILFKNFGELIIEPILLENGLKDIIARCLNEQQIFCS